MACVTTVTYSILINDQHFGVVKPSKSIRQGDPLSPFLFVLCTEGLSFMLNKAEAYGHITGPTIHHLLFANDSLFICKALANEIKALMEILRLYGEATAQFINLSKSSMTFGSRIEEEVKSSLQSITGILNVGGAGTYLGLPRCFSGSKIDLLSFIHDKLKGRMSG